MIKALDRIQTESRHQVASNVGAARAEITASTGQHLQHPHHLRDQGGNQCHWFGLVGGVRGLPTAALLLPAFPG